MIAAFADLEISNVRQLAGEAANARMRDGQVDAVEQAPLFQLGHETPHLGRAEEQVDFGQRVEQLRLVSLDHAADGDDRLAVAGALPGTGFDNRVDRLLLGRVDEPAGVDEDDVGVIGIGGIRGAAILEIGDVPLGVDGVLVAAEGDEGEFQR